MYIWTSVAHVALPLGEVGVQQISAANEPPFLDAMKIVLKDQPGLYIFPNMPPGTPMDEYGKKLKTSPSGLLIYKQAGAPALAPGQLIAEFLIEVVEVLLLAFLLAHTTLTGFGPRFGLVLAVAFLGSTWTNLSYWNWYSFPASYTLASIFVEFTGLSLAGLVAMRILRK
jgi:hypothetical protein